jgi:hypothetical protein
VLPEDGQISYREYRPSETYTMAMSAKVVSGGKGQPGKLVIEIDLQTPAPSASGKTLVVASTHGNQVLQDCKVEGQPLVVGLNAYIRKTS